VIEQHGDQVLVAFGQSNSSGAGPFFTVQRTPHSPLRRETYFYLDNVCKVSQSNLQVTKHRVSSKAYKAIVRFCEEHLAE